MPRIDPAASLAAPQAPSQPGLSIRPYLAAATPEPRPDMAPPRTRRTPQRDQIRPEMVRAWLIRTCAAQGVPVKVADPRVIARVVALLPQPSRQTGSIRPGSNAVRPRTAGRMTARSRTAPTIAR